VCKSTGSYLHYGMLPKKKKDTRLSNYKVGDVFSYYMMQIIFLYCDTLPSNASVICGFWILYLDLLAKSSGGIYN
jgi:hypothetical protein